MNKFYRPLLFVLLLPFTALFAQQKTAEVKTAAHTKVTGVANQTASAAAGTGTKVATKVKTTPAPVKVKTHLNTAAGIKLR